MCVIHEEVLAAMECTRSTSVPRKRWIIRRRGAIVRDGKELTSQYILELDAGTIVETLVPLHWTKNGVTRVQIIHPVQGWCAPRARATR